MILAMDSQNPMNTDMALARQRELPSETVRGEDRLRKLVTLQDFLVHVAIALLFACVAARHINHHPPGDLSGVNIQTKVTFPHLERSAHSM